MDDTISRQAAIDAVAEGLKHTFVEYRDVAEKMVNKVPSAERKKGKWVNRWSGDGSVWLEEICSECGLTFEDEPHGYNYCPNCGAEMQMESQEEVK